MKTSTISTFILLLVLSSCLNHTKLSSNYDKNDSTKIKKAFVLIDDPENLKFFRTFEQEIFQELLAHGVPTSVHRNSLTSLNSPEEEQQKIASFQPSHLITINQVSQEKGYVEPNIVYTPDVNIGAHYLVEVTTYHDKKVIWKGSLKTDEFYEKKKAARKAARKIVADLEAKALIVSGD